MWTSAYKFPSRDPHCVFVHVFVILHRCVIHDINQNVLPGNQVTIWHQSVHPLFRRSWLLWERPVVVRTLPCLHDSLKTDRTPLTEDIPHTL